MQAFLAYMMIVNAGTYWLYGVDKKRAKRKERRIPERVLIMLAIAGGSLGAYIGMGVFHHKTRKPRFSVGIPLILLVQIFLLVYFLYLRQNGIEF